MKNGWEVVQAQADDPIYQQGIIGIGITRPKNSPTESKTLDEDYKKDPDWMEDQNPAGLRRPTISEMLSWAVFEKQTNGRKVLAKARVTTE